MKKSLWTQQIKDMAINDLLDNKLSYGDIFKKYGIPKSTIATWIDNLNEKTKPDIKPQIDNAKLETINIKLNDILHKLNVLTNKLKENSHE